MSDFHRLAIVNRGEAAVRALRGLREYVAETGADIRSIALYTEPDASSWFVREADEAYLLGPATYVEPEEGRTRHTYLDLERLEHALLTTEADAVWVGWGFVAEDADFAALCERHGITFLGPSSEVITRLGDKVQAKLIAEESDVPVAPWSGGPVTVGGDVAAIAERVGYPLLVKATAGGGGRGIRHVAGPDDLDEAIRSASDEGQLGFGDPTVFLERRVTAARHVEVQIVADRAGTVWALGVRDCSLQRRNQKVVEESGSQLPDEIVERLKGAAVRLCQSAGYVGAGTVEFLYDPETGLLSFMEVNTRLQVEHPVTELTTGSDVVKLQIHVARGGTLEGEPPPEVGHAIEVRLNAEDPERGFAPAPGRVTHFRLPAGPGIRVDSGIAEGDEIAAAFDSMVAKILAWGRDRNEALSRMRRALDETIVVIEGGTTNKAFLGALLDRPEVIEGSFTTTWLDQLTAEGGHLPPHHDACVLAAAVEAYDVDLDAERATFLATAARGRPEVRDQPGRKVELRFRGRGYALWVHRLGPGSYRIDTGEGMVDVGYERVGRYERRLVINGETLRVVADVQGPTYLIEVDGTPHRLERDDGGLVRSPSPAVVISIAVATGDEVASGAPLAVLESMKMETTIQAPFAGRVRRVLAVPKAQIDAGAPLVQLEATGDGEDTETGESVDLGAYVGAIGAAQAPRDRYAELLESLRAYLLGYDLDAATIAALLTEFPTLHEHFTDPGAAVVAREADVLGAYADLGSLGRRVSGDGDAGDLVGISSREHLLSYLRTIDRPEDAVPERFLDRLRRALERYGVTSLDRSDELEDALLWTYRAHQRIHELSPALAAILERWRLVGRAMPERVGARLRELLDQVVDAAEGRDRTMSDVAREARFRLVDEPVLEEARADVLDTMALLLERLDAPDGDDRDDLIDELVACPQPLRGLLLQRWFEATRSGQEAILLARTRRYYRIRALEGLTLADAGGQPVATADYRHEDADYRLVVAYLHSDELDTHLDAIADCLDARPGGEGRKVIVDLGLVDTGPPRGNAEVAADVAARVDASRLSRHDLHRVDATFTFRGDNPDHERTRHVALRPGPKGLTEDTLYRNLHPMLAKRVGLWRLSNFELHRLASVEDVYLFHGVAHDNPGDERVFAVAEVRDLTPVSDRDGRVVALPHLERMIAQGMAGMRRYQSQRRGPPLQMNRVILHVRPPVTVPPESWRDLVHRIAPATVGLGLQKVVLHVQIPDPTSGELTETVLHIENVVQHGVMVRLEPPPEVPIQSLSAYRQKVLKTEQRGSVYPYELIERLTPPAGAGSDLPTGSFVEHDLDDAGEHLVPVERPRGGNTANLVVGLITNLTATIPEGMTRVILLSDPSRSLGSLAEAECRRIMAALDLAEERGIPVEWFTVSSGARISMESGTENMDWIGAALRRIIEFTQGGGEINIMVTGMNVGAQPYFNAEATMLNHTKGILVMTPDSAMVLTGKQALDFSGGVSAEDNFGIGGFERIMGPNGQGQYWAPTIEAASNILFRHYAHAYVVPGEPYPRRASTADPEDRDIREAPHTAAPGSDFATVGEIFSIEHNPERKKPFDIRSVMRAVVDADHDPLERWQGWEHADNAVVWDARVGGYPISMIGIESHSVIRQGFAPADGPDAWTAGTLFPQSSRKVARGINAASGSRPLVVLANLSGFDGSPDSMRNWQLEYGAEIGRAVTNFDGPIVFVVISRYHGGAFVVFSKRLNDRMEVAALEGSHASVIGGTPAAAVVFAREVRSRTDADARVKEAQAAVDAADDGARTGLRNDLDRVRREVHGEMISQVAAEFDAVHDITRAQEVGSVDRIVAAGDLRSYVIDAVRRGMGA